MFWGSRETCFPRFRRNNKFYSLFTVMVARKFWFHSAPFYLLFFSPFKDDGCMIAVAGEMDSLGIAQGQELSGN